MSEFQKSVSDLAGMLVEKGIMLNPEKVEMIMFEHDEHDTELLHCAVYLPGEVIYADVKGGKVVSVVVEDRLYAAENAMPSAINGLSNVIDKMSDRMTTWLKYIEERLRGIEFAVWGVRSRQISPSLNQQHPEQQ